LKEIFEVNDEVMFTANGKILKPRDVIPKGVHRIAIIRRLKRDNPKNTEKSTNDEFTRQCINILVEGEAKVEK
jgi:hypothetical protein